MKMNKKLYSYSITVLIYVIFIVMAVHSAHAINAENVFPGDGNGIVINGTYVRKGTVGATFHNILALDKLLISQSSESEIHAILKDQRPLGRGLYVVDLFKMQPIEAWLSDAKRPGKIMVAVMALQESPELRSQTIKVRLEELEKTSHPILQAEITKVLAASE